MAKYTKHHYVPKFMLKEWCDNEKRLWLSLKNKEINNPKQVSYNDVGHEKHLYTSRGGDKSVENVFFKNIDNKASIAHKKLINSESELNISELEKQNYTHFINTLNIRNPNYINFMKNYNEIFRKENKKFTEKHYTESNIDLTNLFVKEKYDDTAKLVEYYSTLGTASSMSKLYKNDYYSILNSKWKIIKNSSKYNLVLSDIPLETVKLSNEKTDNTKLPDKFAILLPISYNKLLIISNEKSFFNISLKMKQHEIIKTVNINSIKRARIQIYSKHSSDYKLISKYV